MNEDQKFLLYFPGTFPVIICHTLHNRQESISRFFEYIQNEGINGTRWIYIEFFECPSILKIDVNTIRAALARWINEECATAIQCNLDSAVEVENVVVGTISCDRLNNFITVLVLRNATVHASLQGYHFYYLAS